MSPLSFAIALCLLETERPETLRRRLQVTLGSRLTTKQRIFTAAICAAILGGVSAPSNAADLGPVPGYGARHIYAYRTHWTWRDRCAYAGYYCLYAEYGYVYHYPFDDRPIAYRRYWRRYR